MAPGVVASGSLADVRSLSLPLHSGSGWRGVVSGQTKGVGRVLEKSRGPITSPLDSSHQVCQAPGLVSEGRSYLRREQSATVSLSLPTRVLIVLATSSPRHLTLSGCSPSFYLIPYN